MSVLRTRGFGRRSFLVRKGKEDSLTLEIYGRVLVRVLVFAASFSLSESRLSALSLDAQWTGVRCERRSDYAITKEHEWRLALSLRRITGYSDLCFASDGRLCIGDASSVAGGSAEARQILARALWSGAGFIIEDYSGSGSVNFGQAAAEKVFEDRGGRGLQIWRLRLDFDDFLEMAASPKVRAAFDEGFTFFHELLHGLGYMDAAGAHDLGECEEIVNRFRSQLGLPSREQYFGDAWRMTDKLMSVRLKFRSQRRGAPARGESHYLFFILTEPAECSANIRAVTRVNRNPDNSFKSVWPSSQSGAGSGGART